MDWIVCSNLWNKKLIYSNAFKCIIYEDRYSEPEDVKEVFSVNSAGKYICLSAFAGILDLLSR